MKSFYLATLLLLLGLPVSWAKDLASMSLMDAYDHSLRNDPAFQSATYGYHASQQERDIGLAPLLPQISLNSRYGDTEQISGQSIDSSGGDKRYNSSTVNLSARQALYDKGKFAYYEQSKAREKVGEALFDEASQDVFNRTVEAYFEVARQENQLNLTLQQKAAVSGLVKQTKRLFEAGDGTITDTEEAQARLDLISAQEIEDAARLQAALRTLSGRTGARVSGIAPMLDSLPESSLLKPKEDLQYWQELALANAPKLSARQASVKVAETEIQAQRAGNFPTLALVSDVNRNQQDNLEKSVRTQSSYYLGLSLELPLYAGGGVRASTRKSEYNLSATLSDYDNERQLLAEAIERDYLGVASGYAKSKALQTAVRSNQRALESAEKGYQAGVRSTVDILNAQQVLFAARRDLLNSKLNMLQSYVSLHADSGLMQRDVLQQVQTLF